MQVGYRADSRGVRDAPTASELLRELTGETTSGVPGGAGSDPGSDAGPPERPEPDGASRVAEALDDLRDHGWTVLHDLHWPGRPGSTVDHVAIGRGGVVVIHVRDWSGTVSVADGWLRQNGFRRDRELDKAVAATTAIRALLHPEHRRSTIGLICLAGQDHELAPTSAGVPVVGRDDLLDVLRAAPVRLTADDVTEIGTLLARRLTRDLIPGQVRSPLVRPARAQPSRPSAWVPWRR